MATLVHTLSTRLNARREALGLSCAALASRTGLSLRTVQRVMSGEEQDPGFGTVTKLADALGVSLRIDEGDDVEAFRRKQAERKAERMLTLVQGTSALEAQALDKKTLRQLKQRTVHELLAGSPRRLWAE